MRIFMLLLILANLGFFAWTQWVEPADDGLPAGRAAEDMGAGLQLATERDAPSVSEPADAAADDPGEEEVSPPEAVAAVEAEAVVDDEEEEPASSATSDVDYRCVSLGPFDQLEVAEIARARLADRGYDARLREAGGQIRSGFWVFLPPQDSRGDAKEIEARLREKGVNDLFIVTGSENRNAISLGLFSTPDRADQRAAEIGRLGFNPQIAERFRDATVYWLDYRERGDDRLEPQSIGVLGADEVIPEKRARDCAAADFRRDGEG
ncbi:MAG: SPOR domain-containing protein [Gammaproteobacteria bacterium]|nr:SPOR domain-containing protein [Gammaproteobacteria bacterium]